MMQLHKRPHCGSTRAQGHGHTCHRHADQVSPVFTLGHLPSGPSLPPSWPSPGVGPTDGLGVLVTGFTRATASLGTCPCPKDSAQGGAARPQLTGASWFLRLPQRPHFVLCSTWAQPDPAPHLSARCCRCMAHLPPQDRQGLLVGVRPLHEHPPAVLPGGWDTESPLPSHITLQ